MVRPLAIPHKSSARWFWATAHGFDGLSGRFPVEEGERFVVNKRPRLSRIIPKPNSDDRRLRQGCSVLGGTATVGNPHVVA